MSHPTPNSLAGLPAASGGGGVYSGRPMTLSVANAAIELVAL
jgi:hypothetical protein